ncbi:hypothetical protein EJ02DRAFT_462078 [Clathrospora elynae]|uniref:GRF-like zinc ribbon domain-containing protein n=1 Tax=Clathrospora elynae TaxID=706981 RepID=A0A6A5T2E9_9PLEO|nr:hypothetical protein EJ02DRAFT_462078 [Clathrospora elynae]
MEPTCETKNPLAYSTDIEPHDTAASASSQRATSLSKSIVEESDFKISSSRAIKPLRHRREETKTTPQSASPPDDAPLVRNTGSSCEIKKEPSVSPQPYVFFAGSGSGVASSNSPAPIYTSSATTTSTALQSSSTSISNSGVPKSPITQTQPYVFVAGSGSAVASSNSPSPMYTSSATATRTALQSSSTSISNSGVPKSPITQTQPYVFVAGSGSAVASSNSPSPIYTSSATATRTALQSSSTSISNSSAPKLPSNKTQPTTLAIATATANSPPSSAILHASYTPPIRHTLHHPAGQCPSCGSPNKIYHVQWKPDSLNVGRPYRSCTNCKSSFNGFADDRGLTPGLFCDCETPALLRLTAKNAMDNQGRRGAFYSCQFKECRAWEDFPTVLTVEEIEEMVKEGRI